jgi:hypothetical protein
VPALKSSFRQEFEARVMAERPKAPSQLGKALLFLKASEPVPSDGALSLIVEEFLRICDDVNLRWRTKRLENGTQGHVCRDFSGHPAVARFAETIQFWGSEYLPANRQWAFVAPDGGACGRDVAAAT